MNFQISPFNQITYRIWCRHINCNWRVTIYLPHHEGKVRHKVVFFGGGYLNLPKGALRMKMKKKLSQSRKTSPPDWQLNRLWSGSIVWSKYSNVLILAKHTCKQMSIIYIYMTKNMSIVCIINKNFPGQGRILWLKPKQMLHFELFVQNIKKLYSKANQAKGHQKHRKNGCCPKVIKMFILLLIRIICHQNTTFTRGVGSILLKITRNWFETLWS